VVGWLLPGTVDHVSLYVGPGTRIIEANPYGVYTFELPNGRWDAHQLHSQRGFIDTLYGVGSPLPLDTPPDVDARVRAAVAAFCLAQQGKPFNFNFFASNATQSFYCTQLIYQAYQAQGVNLVPTRDVPTEGMIVRPILPQELWHGCPLRRRARQQ
jgi:hypothetical protein